MSGVQADPLANSEDVQMDFASALMLIVAVSLACLLVPPLARMLISPQGNRNRPKPRSLDTGEQ
jgi:hypothetical protein